MTKSVQQLLDNSAGPTENSLLGAGEPAPVGLRGADSSAKVLVICDHASNQLPKALGDLGVASERLNEHIGWDIGALGVARGIAEQLDGHLVFGRYSRLAADLNRAPRDVTAIPVISDGVLIPGNLSLTHDQRAARLRNLHDPYHEYIARFVTDARARGVSPVLVSVHSFTPAVSRISRPWQAGILWDKDPRVAIPLLAQLRCEGIVVGDNEPYSGRHTADYTLDRHAEANGLAHAAIELRQDCISNAGTQHIWAERLARILERIFRDESLFDGSGDRSAA